MTRPHAQRAFAALLLLGAALAAAPADAPLFAENFDKASPGKPSKDFILFAGAFRDYGGVVIIDHGKGWTSSITGLGGISVRVGQQVAQGTRIGRAPGGDAPRLTVELRRRGEPMDLARLLG